MTEVKVNNWAPVGLPLQLYGRVALSTWLEFLLDLKRLENHRPTVASALLHFSARKAAERYTAELKQLEAEYSSKFGKVTLTVIGIRYINLRYIHTPMRTAIPTLVVKTYTAGRHE